MIRINLIPTKKKKKAKPLPTFVIILVFLTLVVGGAAFVTNYMFNKNIKELTKRQADNEETIARLKEKIKEVQDFEKYNKLFMDRKNVIESLRKNQVLPVKIMDEISIRLTDGVWVSSMLVSQNKVTIEGSGFTNTDLVTFIAELKKSALFTDVVLLESKAAKQESVDIYNFKVVFAVKA